jgi:hypothetical protein
MTEPADAPSEEPRQQYVAFIDLLGFSKMVERAETDPAERARVRAVLFEVRDTLCNNPALGARLTYASDSLFFDRAPGSGVRVLSSGLVALMLS